MLNNYINILKATLLLFTLLILILSLLSLSTVVLPYLGLTGVSLEDLDYIRNCVENCMGDAYMSKPSPSSPVQVELCGFVLNHTELYQFHSDLRWARLLLIFSYDIPSSFSHMDPTHIEIITIFKKSI